MWSGLTRIGCLKGNADDPLVRFTQPFKGAENKVTVK